MQDCDSADGACTSSALHARSGFCQHIVCAFGFAEVTETPESRHRADHTKITRCWNRLDSYSSLNSPNAVSSWNALPPTLPPHTNRQGLPRRRGPHVHCLLAWRRVGRADAHAARRAYHSNDRGPARATARAKDAGARPGIGAPTGRPQHATELRRDKDPNVFIGAGRICDEGGGAGAPCRLRCPLAAARAAPCAADRGAGAA